MTMAPLLLAFAAATHTFSLPEGLLSAVCWVESSHRPDRIHKDDGSEDSIGLCQVQHTTAKMLGFKGSKKDLLKPTTNAFYAGKYLRYQLDNTQAILIKLLLLTIVDIIQNIIKNISKRFLKLIRSVDES